MRMRNGSSAPNLWSRGAASAWSGTASNSPRRIWRARPSTYSDLSVQTEKKAEILTWLSNAFAPPDSRFTAGYECRFTAQTDQGQARTVAVGIFLTGTLEFAHYTKWPNLQLIPVEHVVDEAHGRAGYGVFKYLTDP